MRLESTKIFFTNYIPLCKALVFLLKPLIEITIHDLSSGTICFIAGNLSKRKAGDLSLINAKDLKNDINKIIYPKINFDGRLIKSTSLLLGENWLLCINCDVSVFSQMQSLSQQFLKDLQSTQPENMFKNDWQEKLNKAIHIYLRQRGWHFENLTSRHKKEIAKYLFIQGAFHEKNAADYIASTLEMGRATIFNYLKEWKNHDT